MVNLLSQHFNTPFTKIEKTRGKLYYAPAINAAFLPIYKQKIVNGPNGNPTRVLRALNPCESFNLRISNIRQLSSSILNNGLITKKYNEIYLVIFNEEFVHSFINLRSINKTNGRVPLFLFLEKYSEMHYENYPHFKVKYLKNSKKLLVANKSFTMKYPNEPFISYPLAA